MPDIQKLVDFIERHGVICFLGVLLCLGGLVWALKDPALAAKGISDIAGVALGPALLTSVGIALLIYKNAQDKLTTLAPAGAPTSTPADLLDTLRTRIEQVLGSLSLSERDEGSREQTARLEELVAYLAVEQGKISLRMTLQVLHAFLSAGKDEYAPGIVAIRGRIERLLSEGETKGFDYVFIQPYLMGLNGLTWLVEGYRVGNANRALPILRDATRDLESLPKGQRYGLSTMLNAVGICHGILADYALAEREDCLRHLVKANEAFGRQLNPRVILEVPTQAVRYRYAVNQVELLANAYWTWSRLAESDSKNRGLKMLAEMIEFGDSTISRMVIKNLFHRLADHFESAKNIAQDPAVRSIKRTALWHSGFIASIAFAHACAHHSVENHVDLNSLLADKIPGYIDRVQEEVNPRRDPRAIAEYFSYSPIVVEGLKRSDLPGLRDAKAHFERIIGDLDPSESVNDSDNVSTAAGGE